MTWLFGSKPPRGYEIVQAKDGRKYWLSPWEDHADYDGTWLWLFEEKTQDYTPAHAIGHIKLIQELPTRDIWVLCELVIKRPYRQTGLATILLDKSISEVRRARGLYLICWATPMTADDPNPNFDLLKWFERRGFVSTHLPQAKSTLHNVVLRIR